MQVLVYFRKRWILARVARWGVHPIFGSSDILVRLCLWLPLSDIWIIRECNLLGIDQILDSMLQGETIISVISKALVISAAFIGIPARGSWVRGFRRS